MNEQTLSQQQITDLARPFVSMAQTIKGYYDNPDHERSFQEWYKQKYGHAAPEGV